MNTKAATLASPGRNPVKRLYQWVIDWSESPYGTWALFLIAFAESSFFPIPPDVLLIALSVGKPKRAMWFAFVCLMGSVLGALLGYWIGYALWQVVSQYFFEFVPGFTPEVFNRAATLYQENADWAIFTAGFTPIPYKVFTICAGVASINIGVFIAASIFSRGLRFFVVAGLIRIFGAQIQQFIDRYFNLLAIVFTILLVGSYFLLKFIF